MVWKVGLGAERGLGEGEQLRSYCNDSREMAKTHQT